MSIFRSLLHPSRSLIVFSSVIASLLSGCASKHNTSDEFAAFQPVTTQSSATAELNRAKKQALMRKQAEQDVWQIIRQGYQFADDVQTNPRIEQQRLWFAARTNSIETMAQRSTPYLHYIVDHLQKRKMPLELALLPMIESAYDPTAYSHSHASGLWQFIPSTGKYFNLKQTSWYDERRDLTASTLAALDYLEYLSNMFEGDWLLALASYNAGEGTVSRAMKRNRELGLPTDYWNLSLPKETQYYVPKFLAVAQIVSSPQAYNVKLAPVANQPYFATIKIEHALDLDRVAMLANIDRTELSQLNAAHMQGVTVDGPKVIRVPATKVSTLQERLAKLRSQDLMRWQQHRVTSGETLHSIAQQHKVSKEALKYLNKLNSDQVSVGQQLTIPSQHHFALAQKTEQLSRTNLRAKAGATTAAANVRYQVRRGDTLSSIARRHGVSINQLKQWNRIAGNNIQVGQTLALRQATRSAAAKKPTYYRVRSGDSLSLIARRHNVSLKQLQAWNPKSSSAIRPGQQLAIYR